MKISEKLFGIKFHNLFTNSILFLVIINFDFDLISDLYSDLSTGILKDELKLDQTLHEIATIILTFKWIFFQK